MSQIHVDTIYDKAGSGRPDFPAGLTASGPTSIGGTLTYEDVTNIDSVGLITARTGIRITAGEIQVGSGATVVDTGNAEFTGIVTSNICFKVGNGAFGPGIGVTITGDGNIVSTGVVTATTFKGDLTGNLTGTPTLGAGVTVYSSGIVSCTSLDAGAALGGLKTSIDAKASTGKAIAMAMVFG